MSDDREYPVQKSLHAGRNDKQVLDQLEELESLIGESTSECLKRSTQLYLPVERVLREHDVELPEVSKRHFVVQAVRNEILERDLDD